VTNVRIAGAFIIIAVLFSYAPLIPMDDCPENHHTGPMKLDCGYLFHCPVLSDIGISNPSPLSLTGRLVLVLSSPNVDELPFLIFHPPKGRAEKLSPWGGILA